MSESFVSASVRPLESLAMLSPLEVERLKIEVNPVCIRCSGSAHWRY